MLRHLLPLHLYVKGCSGSVLLVQKLRATSPIYSEMLCEITKETPR